MEVATDARALSKTQELLCPSPPRSPPPLLGLLPTCRTKVMENNPQLAQVLNDPAMMRQYLDMARNPEVHTDREEKKRCGLISMKCAFCWSHCYLRLEAWFDAFVEMCRYRRPAASFFTAFWCCRFGFDLDLDGLGGHYPRSLYFDPMRSNERLLSVRHPARCMLLVPWRVMEPVS